jgi:hypothetical protein
MADQTLFQDARIFEIDPLPEAFHYRDARVRDLAFCPAANSASGRTGSGWRHVRRPTLSTTGAGQAVMQTPPSIAREERSLPSFSASQ